MWETIKKVLQRQGGTCIIIEDGKPAYVVSSFVDYENLLKEKEPVLQNPITNISEQELLEKINQEIANWKTAQAEQQAPELLETPADEVKIEDLPL